MSSSSSPASSASSTPVSASASFATPGLPTSPESLRPSNAGFAFDKRPERRRSTISSESGRKRRLINREGDGWSASHHAWLGEAGSSSRPAMDSRSIPVASSLTGAGAGATVPGSSLVAPIDLSSSPPPQQAPARPGNTHRTSWAQGADGYMEYIRPRWQPDSEVTNCPICGSQFSFWYRKHHCRKCGRVVCASCSPHRITIPRQFIVRPPESTRSQASTLIPVHAAQAVNRVEGGPLQSPMAINPALGGGEEVRLCNPCVPDPNPEPLRNYTAVRGSVEPGMGWGPSQSRHRTYQSMSAPGRRFPYDAFAESSSSRLNRRSVSSNDYPGFGGAFASSLQERPTSYGSMSSQYSAPQVSSSMHPLLGYCTARRPLPPLSEGVPGRSVSAGGIDQVSRRRTSRSSRRHIDERDICPICNDELPPLGENGNEDAREAHIRDCIEHHGHGRRSSSRGNSPVSPSPAQVRMLSFIATEKDCLGHDGTVQECTICMEEYEVGQPLVRLECLCKFHRRCIIEWFERKKECPVHKVS